MWFDLTIGDVYIFIITQLTTVANVLADIEIIYIIILLALYYIAKPTYEYLINKIKKLINFIVAVKQFMNSNNIEIIETKETYTKPEIIPTKAEKKARAKLDISIQHKWIENLRPRKASNDKELYPEVFAELKQLIDSLFKRYWVQKLSQKLSVTPQTIYAIKRLDLKTKSIAEEWIEKLNSLNETQSSREIDKIYWIASPEDINKLYKVTAKLIDNGMSQSEIALRADITQPMVSLAYNKRIIKSDIVNLLIEKFEKISHVTKPNQLK